MSDENHEAQASDSDAVTGAGGARADLDADSEEAKRAVTGQTPMQAVISASGIADRGRALYTAMTEEERMVSGVIIAFGLVLVFLVVSGVINPNFMLGLLSLTGMYILLSMGLNVQWGYTGLINFSVAAFFGIGAYTAALLASTDSPLTGGTMAVLSIPIVGIFAAMFVAAFVAVLIGIPTLSLREDYLAIASLGLAEVIRIIIKNEQQWTGGVLGILGMPRFIDGWPLIGKYATKVSDPVLNLLTVTLFVFGTWWVLRRIHQSPWGRTQQLIRADEDLAQALGKHSYWLRMQSWVVGSAVMALAGVFFVHLNNSLFPGSLEPIKTFYVWIAVILGGSGSDRGAIIGGIVVVTIIEGTRFFAGAIPSIDAGPLRLLLVGLAIILVMHLRPQGVLPPQRELIWPGAEGGRTNE